MAAVKPKTAVVLSAGGNYGAYQAGAWEVLAPIVEPDIVVGASVGSLNGWAIAGDYMSAATFLGMAGLICLNGLDGFLYPTGWMVAFVTVLLVMAEGDVASSPSRARRAFDTIGSANKKAIWYPKRSNHHLLSDYDGEPAKEAILGFVADAAEIR